MQRISRRSFVKTSVASAMAGALGSSAVASHGPGPFDVAIIGAGAAGISAGRVLARARKRFIILEGLPWIGGRTYTDTTSFPNGIRWDVGAQWLHHSTPSVTKGIGPTNNPLTNIALNRGIDVFPDDNPRFLLSAPGKPVNFLDTEAFKTFGKISIPMALAGLMAEKNSRLDISGEQATADLKGLPYYNLAAGLYEVALGAPLDEMSCAELAITAKIAFLPPCIPTPDNWLIPSGYGTLIHDLAEGLPIRTSTTVNTIRWGSKAGVALETNQGTVVAKKVIVTTPIGPLAAGKIQFVPDLPPRYDDALDGMRMGNDEKIAFYFPGYEFEIPHDNAMSFPNKNTRDVPYIISRAFGHPHFAIVIVAGADVNTAAAQHKLVPYALEQLAHAYGNKLKNLPHHGVASNWNNNVFSMGAYSYALPGRVPSRKALHAPFGNQIYFAGEASLLAYHSAVDGAFLAGQFQAQNIIKSLK